MDISSIKFAGVDLNLENLSKVNKVIRKIKYIPYEIKDSEISRNLIVNIPKGSSSLRDFTYLVVDKNRINESKNYYKFNGTDLDKIDFSISEICYKNFPSAI
jgi:hypothetical protein